MKTFTPIVSLLLLSAAAPILASASHVGERRHESSLQAVPVAGLRGGLAADYTGGNFSSFLAYGDGALFGSDRKYCVQASDCEKGQCCVHVKEVQFDKICRECK